MCLLGKLYQWAMNASKNNQEGSHHQHILKQISLLYIHYPVSISNAQHYIQDIVFAIIQGCNQNFVKGVSLSASKNSQKNDVQRTK